MYISEPETHEELIKCDVIFSKHMLQVKDYVLQQYLAMHYVLCGCTTSFSFIKTFA